MKVLFLSILSFLLLTVSCKKEQPRNTPVPFLTGKIWTGDTITIDPPAAYNLLTTTEQQEYRISMGWFNKKAQLTFNEDGSVTSGGDYDFGYYQWRMINNNKDIEVLISRGTKDTLFNWSADGQQFTYGQNYNPSYNSTLVYK
jgi:hypothetical protein